MRGTTAVKPIQRNASLTLSHHRQYIGLMLDVDRRQLDLSAHAILTASDLPDLVRLEYPLQ